MRACADNTSLARPSSIPWCMRNPSPNSLRSTRLPHDSLPSASGHQSVIQPYSPACPDMSTLPSVVNEVAEASREAERQIGPDDGEKRGRQQAWIVTSFTDQDSGTLRWWCYRNLPRVVFLSGWDTEDCRRLYSYGEWEHKCLLHRTKVLELVRNASENRPWQSRCEPVNEIYE